MEVIAFRKSMQLPKRTRLNVHQSKNGCLTCRSRKVKCDETKPTCLRCIRASKACEGYACRLQSPCEDKESRSLTVLLQTNRKHPNQNGLHPIIHNAYKSNLTPREASLSRLGLELLLHHPLENINWKQQPAWIRLIAQMLAENEAVASAVISLGAVFEVQCLPNSDTRLQLARTSKALTALMSEVNQPGQDLIPVFLASVVLAASEALQRHLENALIHLRGAFRALTSAKSPTTHFPDKTVRPRGCGHDLEDLYSFAQSLDLQTSWYALGEPPRLGPYFQHFDSHTINHINLDIRSLLLGCYHFTNRAANFKYRLHRDIPSSLILEQCRYIALLTEWLAASTEQKKSTNPEPQRLIQRAQCFSTLIYISMILCPYESTYDLYAAHFQQIVEISKTVVALSEQPTSISSLVHFKTQPDLFQPLYFTAMKCRNPHLRRQAIMLFSQFGIEGPWDARIMTRVAHRAIEIEEMGQTLDQKEFSVLELQRIHGCGVDSLAPAGKTFPVTFRAHFSVCRSVPLMIESPNHEDSEHWVLWSEDLETGEFYSGPSP